MDLLEAIRLIAMQNVVEPDYEAFLRHVFRWYSRTFSTPLDEVDDLLLEDVLLHYYEHTYEQLEENDRVEKIADLLKSDEEVEQERRAADVKEVEDAEFVKYAEQIQKYKPKPLIIQGEDEQTEPPAIPLPPPMPIPPPPEINMQFDEIEDNLVSDDVESLNLMRQPEED